MKNGLENIDEVFKQAFDGFESNVNPSVWSNVQNSIATGSSGASSTPKIDPSAATGFVGKSLALKFVAGVVLLGTVATTAYVVLTSEKENGVTKNVVADNKTNQLVEETITPIAEVKIGITKENVTTHQEAPIKNNTNEIINKTENTASTVLAPESTTSTGSKVSNKSTENKVASKEEASKTNVVEKSVEKIATNNSNADTKNETKISDNTAEIELNEESVNSSNELQLNTIPKVITPNGDGINDVIKISGENIDKLEVVIMDKTGKPIFTFKTTDDVFEGKDQSGYNLLPGLYFMAGVIVDKNGKPHQIKQAINVWK